MIPVCPKCDVQLLLLHFRAIEVDFCERCRGIWLDAGELEALLEQRLDRQRDPVLASLDQDGVVAAGPQHLCPRCDQRLREITLSPPGRAALTLDRCPRGHGLWFDAEELQAVLACFPPETGAGKAIKWLNDLFGQPKQGGIIT